jgi:hypothetical protein
MTNDRNALESLREPIRRAQAAPRPQAGGSASAVSALREGIPVDVAAPEASRRRAGTAQRSEGDS